MKNRTFSRFYLISLLGVLLASLYPVYMGGRVVSDMIRFGTVYAGSYPKYIIPYTPISIALIIGVAFMPLLLGRCKGCSLAVASVLSVAVFFAAEFMFEKLIIVTTIGYEPIPTAELEAWQMLMCVTQYREFQTVTAVDILMGQYSPAFKLHFYLISVVLILTMLNCFYGFGRMILTGNRTRLKALVLQSIASAVFLGLCILACFTAFFRTGTIRVSPLSAALMCVFFVTFGITAGIYAGSFLLEKDRGLAILLPSLVSSGITLAMYIGEMILLSGHLYRFGSGFLFDGLPGIILAPVDILVIMLSGLTAGGIMALLDQK